MTGAPRIKTLLFSFCAVLAACTGELEAQKVLSRTVSVDGVRREFLVCLPENSRPLEPIPVLFCFHGGDGTAEGMMRSTADFRPLANANGFIAVYPQGLVFEGATHWNSEGPYDNGTDELGFVAAMIDLLVEEYTADPARIYASGFSLGGNLMWDLACHLGDRFAAVASVAASMWEWTLESCAIMNRTGILSIHGTNDFYNPYDGNQYSISMERLNAHWATVNGSDSTPVTSQFARGVTRQVWGQGEGCHTVEHYRVQNGGHVWPPFSREVIWDFVSRYNLSGLIGCRTPVDLVVNSYNQESREVSVTVNNLPNGDFEVRRSATGLFQSFNPAVVITRNTAFPLTIRNVSEDTLLLQVWERP